jgi:transcriptional regulator with XRE-family HTH domain
MAESTAVRGRDISVGRQIRRLRDDADMTQAELAAAAGVSLDLIRKLEQEVR